MLSPYAQKLNAQEARKKGASPKTGEAPFKGALQELISALYFKVIYCFYIPWEKCSRFF
jgi:hypothetical protein